MNFDFSGKTALITGASAGIGRATAIYFVKQGANVVLLDLDVEKLKQLSNELKPYGQKILFYECDISQEERVTEVCEDALSRVGSMEILVNNAGLWNSFCEFSKSSSKDWKRKIEVNILGTMYVTRAIIPSMIANGYGRIINIASVSGVYGIPTMADYSMTKGAIISFTKALAKEVMANGITVNSVSPGTVSNTAKDCDKCYAGRFGLYEENADLILYLASENAGYISGQNYIIDGCRKWV